MKKRDVRAQRKRIDALFERWVRPIGLAWWGFRFHYYTKRKRFKRNDKREALMITYADWRYRSVEIDINTPAMRDQSDEDLDTYFVHELMHVFLNEMRSNDDRVNHEERVATTLADAFVWIRDIGGKDNMEEKEKPKKKELSTHEKILKGLEELYAQIEKKKKSVKGKK